METCLITGGAGFIGSHIADECLESGQRVVIYDNFSYGRRRNIEEIADSVDVVEGDLNDTDKLAGVIARFSPRIVFHMAAIHHIPTCENHPREALTTNILGTQSLLDAINQAHGAVSRLIFASTGAIYAEEFDFLEEDTTPLRSTNVYGITKKAGEDLLRLNHAKTRLPTLIARVFNAVGARETNDHLVPAIVRQLKDGNRLKLGNLEPKRSYIHVRDLARGFFALATQVEDEFETFNIGTPDEYSVTEVVRHFEKVLSRSIEVVSDPALKRASDRLHQRASIVKITKATSWEPSLTLEDALQDAAKEAGLL